MTIFANDIPGLAYRATCLVYGEVRWVDVSVKDMWRVANDMLDRLRQHYPTHQLAEFTRVLWGYAVDAEGKVMP